MALQLKTMRHKVEAIVILSIPALLQDLEDQVVVYLRMATQNLAALAADM